MAKWPLENNHLGHGITALAQLSLSTFSLLHYDPFVFLPSMSHSDLPHLSSTDLSSSEPSLTSFPTKLSPPSLIL